MAVFAIIAGLSMVAAGLVFMGVQWWRQGVPLGDGRTINGRPARASGAAVIVLGVALGLFGWIWFPSFLR